MPVSCMTKAQLRTTILRRLKQQKEGQRRRRSEAIRRKVYRLTAFRQAKTVFCYVALPYEVQTWRLIEGMLTKGKRVVVPKVARKNRRLQLSQLRNPSEDLAPGAFGVLEPKADNLRPISPNKLDLVVVPGLAFDRRGHRLGHGLGFFDRFLARLPKDTPTIGLAFRFQVFDRLPARAHDRAVKTVLTA